MLLLQHPGGPEAVEVCVEMPGAGVGGAPISFTIPATTDESMVALQSNVSLPSREVRATSAPLASAAQPFTAKLPSPCMPQCHSWPRRHPRNA